MAALAEKQETVPAMEVTGLKPAEANRNIWFATVAEDVNPKDLLVPEYFTNVAYNLRPRDKIEVWAIDGSWYAEYLVMQADRLWARVTMLIKIDTNKVISVKKESAYESYWGGPSLLWCVRRKSDKERMATKFEDQVGAENWIKEHGKLT